MTDARRRNQRTILLLAALFFGPLLVSVFWYFFLQDVRLEPHAQHGELIEPVRPLPEVALAGDAPHADTGELFGGIWSVVYFAPGDCGARCAERLYELRQMRLALGQELDRVQRVWIYDGGAPDAEWLAEEHPDLQTLPADTEGLQPVLAAFTEDRSSEDDEATRPSGEVFFVDPLGNLMMRYPADAALEGIYDDMERLLRYSRIG